MMNTTKIAISLPVGDLKRIEKVRKEMGAQRSTLIDMAIRFWLDHREKQQLIRQYEEGYRHRPESMDETKVFEQLSADAFAEEEWK